MKTIKARHLSYVTAVLTVAAISCGAISEQLFAPTLAQQQDKPVEQVQKNIKVLNGMPSSQLLPVMHFMRTSLGVRCDYCHVAENGKYWMDSKPAKETARRMLRMVSEINKNNFGGRPVVTCNSCHRGSTQPLATPAIGQGAFTDTTRDFEVRTPPPLPTADELFERYRHALGGDAALKTITTRYTRATSLRSKIINSGTPKAAAVNRGESWVVETYQKAPEKFLAVVTTPREVIYQAYNGKTGWIKSSDGEREMTASEVAGIRRQAALHKDLSLKDQYSRMEVVGREKIGNRDTFVVEALSLNDKTERLYFDANTGLLARRVVFSKLAIGLDPEQTDYEDYRRVGLSWLPYTVRVSYLDDNHYGTTRKVHVVKQNLPIDDSKFEFPGKKK